MATTSIATSRRTLVDIGVNQHQSKVHHANKSSMSLHSAATVPPPPPQRFHVVESDTPFVYVRRNNPYLLQVLSPQHVLHVPLPFTAFFAPVAAEVMPPVFDVSACSDSQQWQVPDVSFEMPPHDHSFATPVKVPFQQHDAVLPSQRPSPTGRRVLTPCTETSPVTPPPTVTAHSACVALVAFNVRATWFSIFGRELTAVPSPGTYVVVPGDRGVDVGIVIQVSNLIEQPCDRQWASSLPVWRQALAAPPVPNCLPRFVIERRATVTETDLSRGRRAGLPARIALVQTAIDVVANRSEENSQLRTIRVVAVEDQFDDAKVTIYFKSSIKGIRIATLAAALFTTFHCRVWMHQVQLDNTD